MQKKAVRNVTKSSFIAHTDPMFGKQKILKFKDLTEFNAKSIMYKHFYSKLLKSFDSLFQLLQLLISNMSTCTLLWRQIYLSILTKHLTRNHKTFKWKSANVVLESAKFLFTLNLRSERLIKDAGHLSSWPKRTKLMKDSKNGSRNLQSAQRRKDLLVSLQELQLHVHGESCELLQEWLIMLYVIWFRNVCRTNVKFYL